MSGFNRTTIPIERDVAQAIQEYGETIEQTLSQIESDILPSAKITDISLAASHHAASVALDGCLTDNANPDPRMTHYREEFMDDMLTERVTLELDEDVLEVARDQAEGADEPLGKVVSRLARHGFFALREPVVYPEGFEPLNKSQPLERIVTLGFVNRLRDELP